ncbi:MAG TPA: FtsX-like permease family protein [Vulgatibacter sp.]|nr:FtsX-like permease family protein [Vulgatibacter sp.]
MASNSVGLLLRLALRSLKGHRVKVLIVGSLLAFGTFLLVFGTTLLGNVERAMEASVTGSLTGQIQIVSDKAKDQLAFYGPQAAADQDMGTIPSFPEVKEALLEIPNVRAVVPMGRHIAQPILGNELDELISEVRGAVRAGDADMASRLSAKVRRQLGVLLGEYRNRLALSAASEEVEDGIRDLETATSDEFWADFAQDPEEILAFLDTRIAKLMDDNRDAYVPFVGTDLQAFAESFESFELVEGEMVPEGQRGFLFNKHFFEDFSKNKVARILDKIHEARTLDGKRIALDPGLQAEIAKARKFTRYVTDQLDPVQAETLEAELGRLLPEEEGTLDEKVSAFLAVDDDNFDERYRFFYDTIAPMVRMYRVRVGDTLTLRSFTRAGYPKAINVKVWGTFRFKGLERSALASAYSLVDLMSFRELFGLMTVEKRQELDSIRAEVGVEELSRDSIEDALFGGSDDVVEEYAAAEIDIDSRVEGIEAVTADLQDSFRPEDVDEGTVLNAAVVLRDPTQLRQTLRDIEEVSAAKGLEVKAMPWLAVTGIVGQLILVLRAVLWVIILIIFVVALVIINNSMVMATMDRVSEIGTMRAIGAERRFVLSLFLMETLVLGAFASGAGAGLSTGLTLLLGRTGIPASSNDFLIFLFGGPALHPTVSVPNILFGLAAILAVSVISTLYPARIAASIAPVVAMQRKE